MRYVVLICFSFICKTTGGLMNSAAPRDVTTENKVFLITLDGFRWQELFYGADTALLFNTKFTHDAAAKEQYWAADYKERRKKLLPFFWNTMASEGQLFGNRHHGNNVDVTNLYRLSYPGYNEILTGKADLSIYSNNKKHNRNKTLLEYLNGMPDYTGKVAAFTSWNRFSYILNKQRSNLHINCAYDEKSNFRSKLKAAANAALPRFYDKAKNTRNDWATFYAAQHYIVQNLPKVMFIGLGGTDEYAHQKKYGRYLQQAHQADSIIGELWRLVQSIPFYKGHTTFVITTDHGRGNRNSNWHKHGFLTEGSSQTWLAMLGNGIDAMGEVKGEMQLHQNQVAGTVSTLLGVRSFGRASIPAGFYTAPSAEGE
jgi:hypothetical protein